MAYWGYHLVLDCAELDHAAITSYDTIYNFVKTLVKDIDMVAYGPIRLMKFGTGNKSGYSMFQMIETSNISAHFCDEDGSAYLDIFSCKPYDKEVVKQIAKEYFKPSHITEHYIERDANKNVELR